MGKGKKTKSGRCGQFTGASGKGNVVFFRVLLQKSLHLRQVLCDGFHRIAGVTNANFVDELSPVRPKKKYLCRFGLGEQA